MLNRLGRLTTAHPWAICAGWILAGIVLSVVAPPWETTTQDDDIRFLPGRCPSVRGYALLEKAFPQEVFASSLIFAVERDAGPLTSEDFRLVDNVAGDLRELRQTDPTLQIGNITCYRDGFIGRRLVSADGHCTLVRASLATPSRPADSDHRGLRGSTLARTFGGDWSRRLASWSPVRPESVAM